MKRGKLHVLHFAHNFYPIPGGTSTRIFNLLKNDENLYSIVTPRKSRLYIPSNLHNLKKHEEIGNFKIYRVDLLERFLPIPFFRFVYFLKENSRRLFRESLHIRGVNIVHAHNPYEFALASLKYADFFGLPYIYEVHTIHVKELRKSRYSILPAPLYRFIEEFFMKIEEKFVKRASYIILQTEEIRKQFVELYPFAEDKVVVIPNGVDRDFFKYRQEKLTYELKDSLAKNKKLILFSGYLAESTQVDFLLDAAIKAPYQLKRKATFVFVGKGPLKDKIISLSRDIEWIKYGGTFKFETMPYLYSAADIFLFPKPVIPSRPLKFLEAISTGLPVLTSDEVIGKKYWGSELVTIYRDRDLEDFIEKLSFLLEREINREIVKIPAIPTWKDSKEKLLSLYQKIFGDFLNAG